MHLYRGRLTIGLTSFVVGAVYLAMAIQLPMGSMARPGPGIYPVLVGVALCLASGGVALAALLRLRVGAPDRAPVVDGEAVPDAERVPDPGDTRLVVWAALVMVAYPVALAILGFGLGTLVVSIAMMYVLAPAYSHRRRIVVAVSVTAAAWLLFRYGLDIPLPQARWA